MHHFFTLVGFPTWSPPHANVAVSGRPLIGLHFWSKSCLQSSLIIWSGRDGSISERSVVRKGASCGQVGHARETTGPIFADEKHVEDRASDDVENEASERDWGSENSKMFMTRWRRPQFRNKRKCKLHADAWYGVYANEKTEKDQRPGNFFPSLEKLLWYCVDCRVKYKTPEIVSLTVR